MTQAWCVDSLALTTPEGWVRLRAILSELVDHDPDFAAEVLTRNRAVFRYPDGREIGYRDVP